MKPGDLVKIITPNSSSQIYGKVGLFIGDERKAGETIYAKVFLNKMRMLPVVWLHGIE